MMNYWFTTTQLEEIKSLYLSGLSSQEIKDKLNIPHSVRAVQRRVKAMGINRSLGEAFRLAISRGRVTYHTNPNKIPRRTLSVRLRAEVFTRDGEKCVKCGNTARESRLQIDHIDENKNHNVLDNLQVLCEECNKGKAVVLEEPSKVEVIKDAVYKFKNSLELTREIAKPSVDTSTSVSLKPTTELPKTMYPGKLCPKHHVNPIGHGYHER